MNTTPNKIKPIRYDLRFVTDLLSVPDDRLDDCLDTLKQMIRTLRVVTTAASAQHQEDNNFTMTEAQKEEFIRFCIPSVTWIDDGLQVNTITNNGQPMLTVAVSVKESNS